MPTTAQPSIRASSHGRQRGATLTEYALTLAVMVVAAMGSMVLLEDNSETFLTDSGTNIGEPRQTDFALESPPSGLPGGNSVGTGTTTTTPPPTTAPPSTTSPPTTLDPSIPTAFATGPKSAAPAPTKLDGDAVLVGSYPPGADLSWNGSAYDDDKYFFVFQEGRVLLDAAWEVPGSSPAVTLSAGDAVCAYYVHYSPAAGIDEKPADLKIEFGVPIVGVVRTDAGLSQTDAWMGGAPPPSAPSQYDDGQRGLETNEEIAIKDADGVDDSKLELDKVEESYDSSDDIRIFTRC